VRHRRLVDRDFGWPGEIWTAVISPKPRYRRAATRTAVKAESMTDLWKKM